MNNQENLKIAVFASGNGSNFEVIAEAIQNGSINAELSLLICDQPEAYVLKRAEAKAIPATVLQPKQYQTKKEFETVLLKHLENHEIDLIILAGYMRIIGKTLLDKYTERIINIHPSLLPEFPGKSGIEDAFTAGVSETGVTVHLVDQGVDTGPILSQQKVMVESDETLESLEEKIHKLEHLMYPNVIQTYIEKLQKEQVNS
ncbi:phosphoribosylglycinamide formyltransferase [Marinilactibacillus sp. Marseille-P9653]|uniref:phosphoribosylglycinamide formyltransferase n=1 Tax=Marinilactibacillus sp. Marseille-P9653 TaxID=2866583 RepID=UPI001CE4AA9B|nr:phosphoribosylglycinamide formyltransferase [Marinilactibacillus sp. Marseille-P9653]